MLGKEKNTRLKFRTAFKNEWQNIRAFVVEGAVSNLCPAGFKFVKGSRQSGDPVCDTSAKRKYSPVAGCDECVADKDVCGTMMISGDGCPCPNGKQPKPPTPAPPPPPPCPIQSPYP